MMLLMTFKLLHTSDWHLGRMLYGRKRHAEFSRFLDWMLDVIEAEKIDGLVIAGDIFDTTTPSNSAQGLYYSFLTRVSRTCCRHVVVVGGNHDSASFLNAPQGLLKSLNVHVFGSCSFDSSDDILLLSDASGEPELIVGAVPYLRDRDIRTVEAGENLTDKTTKLAEGIKSHYQKLGVLALEKRLECGKEVPIVFTGHLFAAGGESIDGDGVRELYIGTLARITSEYFPECLNYLALGHLHVPQVISGHENMRYSGSPLPMGFGEATHVKSVCLVEFYGKEPKIRLIDVPRFQSLRQIKGDLAFIKSELANLVQAGTSIWVEVIYNGSAIVPNLRELIDAAIDGSPVEVIKIKNNQIFNAVLSSMEVKESLEDLKPSEVFNRCLLANNVPEDRFSELFALFASALEGLYQDEASAGESS